MAKSGLSTIPIPTLKSTAHPYINIAKKKHSDRKKEEETSEEDKTPARASSPTPAPSSGRSTSHLIKLFSSFSKTADSSDVSKSRQ